MPNRIIKESICTSDNLDKLSAFQETMFYRLIVNCDDYGRMDARPKILASKLFPLKDIRVNQIEDGLRALTSAELVIIYTVDGKPFLQMKTWECHQQIRAKKSKYPAPESGVIESDSTCNQMESSDGKCPRNPIQSESVSESNPNPSRGKGATVTEKFAKFWDAYPRKTAKSEAMKAFAKLNPDDSLMETIMNAIEKQKQSDQWKRDGGQYIPHPATWLNQQRWEDELPLSNGNTPLKVVTAAKYTQREYTEDELAGDTTDELMREAAML